MDVEEIWTQYGASEKRRFILVHKLSVALREMKSKAILKSHVLSRCDILRKVGTKAKLLKKLVKMFCKHLGETMTVMFNIHVKNQKNILLKYGVVAYIVQYLII